MRLLSTAACVALLAGAAGAAPAGAQTVAELQARIDAQDARIRELETKIERLTAAEASHNAGAITGGTAQATAGAAVQASVAPGSGIPRSDASGPTPSRLVLGGDVRVRYESNFGDNDARNWDRGVLRARLRASYAVNDWLTVGGQIATGDPDDPNSTDITLSGFDDDLDVSLDQAYIKGSFLGGNLVTHLGKMPQPFMRTELVWDGDVSPQGASVAYKLPLGGGALTASAHYFLIDESVAGPDSDMIGGQIGVQTASNAPLRFEAYVGYYDYALGSLAGGDSGDFRSNRLAGGRYLSDFDLLDVIASATWSGLGARWPVKLVGDYVHNFGSVDDEDSGFGVDLLVGNTSAKGDWRFGYGYAEVETDAVLAAFSHDNTTLATNYLQHTLSVDYVPVKNVLLTTTFYRFRPKNPLQAGSNDPDDWLNRLRLNLLVNF